MFGKKLVEQLNSKLNAKNIYLLVLDFHILFCHPDCLGRWLLAFEAVAAKNGGS
jgi:hypothetical protein